LNSALLVAFVILHDFLYATFESCLRSDTRRSRTSICSQIFDANSAAFFRFGPITGTSSNVSESTFSDLVRTERASMASLCRARLVWEVKTALGVLD
jgi:hypothetical protein